MATFQPKKMKLKYFKTTGYSINGIKNITKILLSRAHIYVRWICAHLAAGINALAYNAEEEDAVMSDNNVKITDYKNQYNTDKDFIQVDSIYKNRLKTVTIKIRAKKTVTK